VLNFMTIMKSEGAESVGTSQISAPMPAGRKTASEAALVQQVADLTKSLQSKIIGRSEQDFWSHWYWRRHSSKSSAAIHSPKHAATTKDIYSR
jgi:hypothetical protein